MTNYSHRMHHIERRHAHQVPMPHRRAYDPLALFTETQRHQHALMQIRMRGGRLAPLPTCFLNLKETS